MKVITQTISVRLQSFFTFSVLRVMRQPHVGICTSPARPVCEENFLVVQLTNQGSEITGSFVQLCAMRSNFHKYMLHVDNFLVSFFLRILNRQGTVGTGRSCKTYFSKGSRTRIHVSHEQDRPAPEALVGE